jgi:hypothetical protein
MPPFSIPWFGQALALSFVSFLYFLMTTLPTVNIVLNSFGIAGWNFYHGISPYIDPQPNVNQFNYPLPFAMLFGALSGLCELLPIPQKLGVILLWMLINIVVFWIGICRWCDFSRKQSPWMWLGLLVCAADLDIALRFHQSNPLIAGLLLIGLAEFRDQRYFASAAVLSLGAGLKVYALLFACLLVLKRPKFIIPLGITFLLVIFLPALVVGFNKTLLYHQEWFRIFFDQVGGDGNLDLRTSCTRAHGFPPIIGNILGSLLVLSGGGLLIAQMVSSSAVSWNRWVALGLSTLVMSSPRTEEPTFVLLVPALILLLIECATHRFPRLLLEICWISLSSYFLLHGSVRNEALEPLYLVHKTYGGMGVWILSFVLSLESYGLREIRRHIPLRIHFLQLIKGLR